MASRSGAIHVATTRRAYKGRVYETHLLRRTYRAEGKVKHQTLGNLSHLPPEVIDLIRRSLKGETMVSACEHFECVRSLPHGQVAATLGSLRQLGLEELLAAKACRNRSLVAGMIVARILFPASKLATARALADETATTTLGQTLEVSDANEDEVYAAMDWLLSRQEKIENELAKRHLDNTLVLYDVTSTYFEGKKCPLAKLGHNRDGKKGKLQIVIGLLCNRDGIPVAVEVFEGNTGDPRTVASQVRKLKDRFGLERVVLVGDRGMLTEARIKNDIDPVDGLSYITALRAPAIQELANNGVVTRSLFDETDLAEVTSPDFPGERLVVCRNPLLAEERRRKREALLAATERVLSKVVDATQRKKRPLRGAGNIGIQVGRVKDKYKVGKHFRLEISNSSFAFSRIEEKIAKEAALDGIYVIRTDVPKECFSAFETVRTYKSLSRVERAFRTLKMIDLKIRPIFHRLENRVRAHVFLCMLAYYVEWHMRQKLAPLLFDDHERELAESERESIVAKAKRSKAAELKARTKRTHDGFPVMSFRDLLAYLGTIVKSEQRVRGTPSPTFTIITTSTDHQRRALDFLGVSTTV